VRIHTVQRDDWPAYREIRLAALRDAPSAFASTWERETAFPDSRWIERAQGSQDGQAQTIVVAVDADGRWAGLAGGLRPGDAGIGAELISMWVAPDSRGQQLGGRLISAVVDWARQHGATTIGLWVTETNKPAIRLYEASGFQFTGEVAPLPSDPQQQEGRMVRDI